MEHFPRWHAGRPPLRGRWAEHFHRRHADRPPLRWFWAWIAIAWMGMGWVWHFHRGRPFMPLIFVVLAAASAAFSYVTGRFTNRLDRLRYAAERLNLRDLKVRAPVEGNDAVAALARAFNRMVDRLAAEERARRQLFADVAHEIRHPLAQLRGRLESIQDGVLPLDGEQVLLLHDTVLGLTRLVGDLRDLSLADVGQLSLNLSSVRLADLVEQLRENMEPVALDRGIVLESGTAADMPPLTADADRVRQVVVNLLANALHYTPPGGRVELTAWGEGGQAVIRVSDTGPGIDPASLPHLFDRFYRADKARSRTAQGSGLGLAIVRSLVELHGGTVAVESPPGGGSRFTVRLPLAGPERA